MPDSPSTVQAGLAAIRLKAKNIDGKIDKLDQTVSGEAVSAETCATSGTGLMGDVNLILALLDDIDRGIGRLSKTLVDDGSAVKESDGPYDA